MLTSTPWSIYYADGSVVSGHTMAEWQRAPDKGVQAVVQWEKPVLGELRWTGVFDRRLWTGEEKPYDPFGWGPKHGSLISDKHYKQIADRAMYGSRPNA